MNLLVWLTVWLGCAAMFEDLRHRTIANWITLTATVAGLVYHTVHGGLRGLAASAVGAAAGFGVFLIFYLAGGMGGGDVKLTAAFGALLGLRTILAAALLAAILGALMAGVSMVSRRRARAIPYAPAITLGAWLALWSRG